MGGKIKVKKAAMDFKVQNTLTEKMTVKVKQDESTQHV